jgi:Ni/Fe-hydrogenase subunit HybB-like protein
MTANPRQRTVKTILWALMGVLGVVTLARFIAGLGATTSLTDTTPWGLWIAFDVMAGVALSAGGFVLAATVYVFKFERYRPFVRPAILTAFLGYIAVAIGLLYDLGLPWHIWHPAIYPQPHSVLFEVAMCVMLYLTVLFLEFSPVILEHKMFDRPVFRSIHKVIKRLSIVFVITGVVLSTLHQSSLGSLFLITPHRLHPLWYSPYIWIFFFISAVGLGIMMVTLEAFFSAWLFHHKLEARTFSGLAKAAAVVLFLYAGLRVGDLAIRGELHRVTDGSPLAMLFLFELFVSAILPGVLLSIRRVRRHRVGLLFAAASAVFGIVGYRFNTCIVAFDRPPEMAYFPAWSEIAVSAGIVAAALLVFIFFCEHLKVFEGAHGDHEAPRPLEGGYHPGRISLLLPPSMAYRRGYSLAAIMGAAFALGMLPSGVIFGENTIETPVLAPLEVPARVSEAGNGEGHAYEVDFSTPNPRMAAGMQPVMVIDGNRNSRQVLFPHDKHKEELGKTASCPKCHHQNVPFKLNTSCAACHRDMYTKTDVFDHTSHIEKLGDNGSCVRCHKDAGEVKSRETAEKCETCHAHMVDGRSIVPRPEKGMTGMAPGYTDAMHGLCVTCHEKKHREDAGRFGKWFKSCANCHRDSSETDLRKMAPYVQVGDSR